MADRNSISRKRTGLDQPTNQAQGGDWFKDLQLIIAELDRVRKGVERNAAPRTYRTHYKQLKKSSKTRLATWRPYTLSPAGMKRIRSWLAKHFGR
jgi:hypothetical protein